MILDRALRDLGINYERSRWESVFNDFLREASDPETKIALLCRAARYYYATGAHSDYARALSAAQSIAPLAPIVSQIELTLLDAFVACANWRIEESDALLDKLEGRKPTYLSQRAWIAALRGRNALHKGLYTLAIEESQDALACCAADPSADGFANMSLGYAFNGMLRYEEGLRYLGEYLAYTLNTGWRPWIASAHAILSATLLDAGQDERARMHRDLALELDQDLRYSIGASSEWFAHMQLKLEGPHSALPLAERSLSSALQRADSQAIAASNILLGRIHFAMLSYDEALSHFQTALEFEHAIGDVPRLTLYRNTALCLRAMDRKIETADLTWKLWELQRDFDSRTHAALLGYQVRLESKIHAQQMELMRIRADQLERDLSQTASQLVSRTEILTRFRDEINTILHDSSDPMSTVKEIRQKLKTLPVEEMNWTTFDAQFTSVHPDFTAKLLEKYPDLSTAEVRLCKLLRLNLKSADIARLFCLSERTIETQRFAVRKKLGLKRTDNVADALSVI
jgi:tetratricopeptide (TPR) repeat protein/DNA-binding CsgD family transcriptional regulator